MAFAFKISSYFLFSTCSCFFLLNFSTFSSTNISYKSLTLKMSRSCSVEREIISPGILFICLDFKTFSWSRIFLAAINFAYFISFFSFLRSRTPPYLAKNALTILCPLCYFFLKMSRFTFKSVLYSWQYTSSLAAIYTNTVNLFWTILTGSSSSAHSWLQGFGDSCSGHSRMKKPICTKYEA